MLIAFNTSDKSAEADIAITSNNYRLVAGSSSLQASKNGSTTLNMPALSFAIYELVK